MTDAKRMCNRRYRLVSLVLLAAAALTGFGCGTTTSTTAAHSRQTTTRARHHRRARRHTRTAHHPRHRRRTQHHNPSRKVAPALACAAPANVLAGVYHPSRLHVRAACRSVSGTVVRVRHEEDGDLHIDLDTGGALTNAVNVADQGGTLVVEFMARDGGHLRAPGVGDHISLTGAWVLDTDHGWNELHPVWSETLHGVRYRSGPQFGGSPAGVGSGEAAAACRAPSGPCLGYGRGSSSEESGASPATTAPGSGISPSSGPGGVPASHLHAGEFCSTAKEPFYEANGYMCSPGSDGRERLHTR